MASKTQKGKLESVTSMDDIRRDALLKRLENDFTYHPPTPEQQDKYVQIRDAGHQFSILLVNLCPIDKDLATAIQLVRQAVMMANSSIACEVKTD